MTVEHFLVLVSHTNLLVMSDALRVMEISLFVQLLLLICFSLHKLLFFALGDMDSRFENYRWPELLPVALGMLLIIKFSVFLRMFFSFLSYVKLAIFLGEYELHR